MQKGSKVTKHCVFPIICGSGGSKSRLAKAAGAGAIWPDERWKVARGCGKKRVSKSKCTKHIKAQQRRTTFGSWDVQKVHEVVARSAFPSQKCKTLMGTEHFWRFRCRFVLAGARDCAPCQKRVKREGFVAVSITTTTTLHSTTLHYKYNYKYNYDHN